MQDVSFSDVGEFLDYLPSDQLEIVQLLREMIIECIPGVTEKLSYNVPFYKRRKGVCFIWPSAVPWGGMKQSGVMLGFNQGYRMRDESGYLEKGDRKQVYVKVFGSASELDYNMVRMFLFEALRIDDEPPLIKSRKAK